jgi:nicotinamidase/pyrazinamidase
MFPAHCVKDTKGSKIIDELEVLEEDNVIKKRRYSAFYGTDLDLYLREQKVDEIYLVGVCTNT